MNLVSGAPSERRHFLDTTISQLYPHYLDLVQKYQKSLVQRNHLLRQYKGGADISSTLPIWDESLVGFGSAIMEYRHRYILHLAKKAGQYYHEISGGKENLSIRYQTSIPIATEDGFQIKDVSERYRFSLEESLDDDCRSGFTSMGVHRDDISLHLLGKSARLYGSQGQKRSCVLALKLAESDVIAAYIGEEPVIFLDDVLSELDERRQHYILSHLRGKQVFITGCERPIDPSLPEGKVFYMKKGQILTEI